MKKFICNIFLFCFCFLLILTALYFKSPNPIFYNSYIAAQIDKDEILQKDTSTSRIIIIGGSNATFGINSEMLSKELSIKVINYSLHAGFGLNFILNKSEDFIHQGDIILLFPEYQHFFQEYYFGEEILARYVVNGNLKDLTYFTPKQIKFQLPSIFRMLIHKVKNVDLDNSSKVYSRYNFNKYGDFIGHLDCNINKENKILAHDMTNLKLNVKAFSRIVCFSENVKNRNASLFISFPSIQKETYLKNIIQIEKVYKVLSSNELILIDEPSDNTFSDSLLFDSPYHLNKKGREMRTKNLIVQLKKILK